MDTQQSLELMRAKLNAANKSQMSALLEGMETLMQAQMEQHSNNYCLTTGQRLEL